MAKKHIAGAAAIASALVLAGCSGGGGGGGEQSGDPSGEITVLTNRTDLVEDGTYGEYVAAFNEEYPDVEVTIEDITDYEGEVTTRLSTPEYGDVLGIPASVTPDQLPQFFEPLGDTEEMKEQYRFLNDKSFEGQQYGLPTFGNASGIIYNKRIWEEAGVTEVPTTPEEFLAALTAIQDNTDAIPYYTNYADGWPLANGRAWRASPTTRRPSPTVTRRTSRGARATSST